MEINEVGKNGRDRQWSQRLVLGDNQEHGQTDIQADRGKNKEPKLPMSRMRNAT